MCVISFKLREGVHGSTVAFDLALGDSMMRNFRNSLNKITII